MKQKKVNYQFVVVFSPKNDEKGRDSVWQKIEKWSQAGGSLVTKKEELGEKDLSYEIAGQRKGSFWTVDLESKTPVNLAEVNLLLNRDSNVIRYLILRI